MATTAGTSPTEVRVVIDTGLDDPEINDILDRVERDIDREYDSDPDVTFADSQHRQDFESALAALRIATGKDRRASQVSGVENSLTYEASEVRRIRAAVRRNDPGEAFTSGGTIRDSDRHVRSASRSED